jgi:hypothetical protein
MAIELDNNRWKLGFTIGFGQRPRERNVASRDTTGLKQEIRSAKRRFNLPENCRVLSCYEAGREGFWSTFGRVHYTLITLAALTFTWFVNYWNLLGWRL